VTTSAEDAAAAPYPTSDSLRNAYGVIMYWADLRLSQQCHAQQCCLTCEQIKHQPDPDDVRKASETNGHDLLMAARFVAKLGGFEQEHEQNRIAMFERYWNDESPERFRPSPWDAYGRAEMGLPP